MSDTLSTGVLRRNSDTQYLVVDVMNIDPNVSRTVTVLMYDWSSGSPELLSQFTASTTIIGPNKGQSFISNALPSSTFAYEVRVSLQDNKEIIANVFGLSAYPFDPKLGNNVMQHSLTRLKLK